MNEIIQSSVYTTQKGTPVTDSVKVARVFDKLHKNVMKSIRNILGSAKNLAHQNWFAETTYMDAQGKRQPMFLMNRDGFSLLVMGFTGEKALEWKVKYINAFNAMEQKLRNKELEKPKQANERDKAMLLNAQSRQATLFMKLSESSSIP
mgnify:CR=1 FL=1